MGALCGWGAAMYGPSCCWKASSKAPHSWGLMMEAHSQTRRVGYPWRCHLTIHAVRCHLIIHWVRADSPWLMLLQCCCTFEPLILAQPACEQKRFKVKRSCRVSGGRGGLTCPAAWHGTYQRGMVTHCPTPDCKYQVEPGQWGCGAVAQQPWPQGCKTLPTSSRPHEGASTAPTRPGLAGSSCGAVSRPQPDMRVAAVSA